MEILWLCERELSFIEYLQMHVFQDFLYYLTDEKLESSKAFIYSHVTHTDKTLLTQKWFTAVLSSVWWIYFMHSATD